MSVTPRLAPAGSAIEVSGAGCAVGDAVSVVLQGPIVPPGPGGPVTVLGATADGAGSWSITAAMPPGSSSVVVSCGGQFSGGMVISAELASTRPISVVWIDAGTASFAIAGGAPLTPVDLLAPDGRLIGTSTFDGAGMLDASFPVPHDVGEVYALGREFLLLEFPSPAAWRGVLPERPGEVPPATSPVVTSVPPDATAGPSTLPQTTTTPAALIPETGAGSTTLLAVGGLCVALGGLVLVLVRAGGGRRSLTS